MAQTGHARTTSRQLLRSLFLRSGLCNSQPLSQPKPLLLNWGFCSASLPREPPSYRPGSQVSMSWPLTWSVSAHFFTTQSFHPRWLWAVRIVCLTLLHPRRGGGGPKVQRETEAHTGTIKILQNIPASARQPHPACLGINISECDWGMGCIPHRRAGSWGCTGGYPPVTASPSETAFA